MAKTGAVFGSRRLLSGLLMVLAVAWIVRSVWYDVRDLDSSSAQLSLQGFAIAILPALAQLYTSAYVFYLLLQSRLPIAPTFRHVLTPFVASQVVRYLPGKIWGILYQAQNTARWAPARPIWEANVEYLLLNTVNSVAIGAGIFLYYFHYRVTAVAFFAAYFVLLALVLRRSLPRRLIGFFTQRLFGRRHDAGGRNGSVLRVVVFLQIEWLFYLLVWFLILPEGYSFEQSLIIAVGYALAWLIGALAFVLPSGLFVREASFLWLTGLLGFEAGEMFLLSVLARLLFVFVDLTGAALAVAIFGSDRRLGCVDEKG